MLKLIEVWVDIIGHQGTVTKF